MTVIPKQRHIHWVDEICDMWLGQIPTYMHQFMWLGQIPTNMNPNHASLLNTLINHRSTTILHIFFTRYFTRFTSDTSCLYIWWWISSPHLRHTRSAFRRTLFFSRISSLYQSGCIACFTFNFILIGAWRFQRL